MYSWKLTGVWMKTGSRLEVDWKWTGRNWKETGKKVVQPNFEVVRTLYFSLLDFFFCFFYRVQWIINDIYFSDSKVLDISTKIEYIAQNHNSQKEKKWHKNVLLEVGGVWLKTGSRLEVDWKWIGSRLEQTGGRLEVDLQ